MTTQAIYLSSDKLHGDAELIACFQDGEQWIAVLDQTLFHPQGGGQPGDTGRIQTYCGEVAPVLHTRLVDGVVHHVIPHALPTGPVTLALDKEPRKIHSLLHSIGHLIGNIGQQNGWHPVRAHYWPNECQVEFAPGTHVVDLDGMTVSQHLRRLIEAALPVQIETRPDGTRFVGFGFLNARPCDGTHIHNTREIPSDIDISTQLNQGHLQVHYQIANAN
ncbi:hypothetical protein KDD30_09910 [Photobacterium sp. GJ3]|uniref:hypothetical protein n=1 Tax=Photobacterium sp. GJ3 TaxID=2829502 RepID=UPI001B8D4840|nr:hypothetical protein [Photobacterium sp. GJ3]QUJ66483.1 hypothetical protein KDD30_09910 [Photobacterium sp. GJ3]